MNKSVFGLGLAAAAAIAAVVLLGGAAAVTSVPAAMPAPAAGQVASFSSFQLIGNLNIFNPNRVGYVPGGQPRAETISFVGTMDSVKGRLAFFNSSNRSFRKAVGKGGMIADFTVTGIETDRVELTKNSRPTSLAMGQQLLRPPGGEWEPGAGASLPVDVSSSTPSASVAPAIPADADDVVKRLMERRQQQLKQ